MSEKSIWENLGRGVGHGWEKARELGDQLHQKADKRLDLVEARRRLAEAYRELGLRVAESAAEKGAGREESLPIEGVVKELLEKVRRDREEIARLEAEHDDKPDEEQEAQGGETGGEEG